MPSSAHSKTKRSRQIEISLGELVASHFESLEDQVPPAYLPKLTDVESRGYHLTAKISEYGCGAYGCVYPTLDPGIVMKVTTDDTEAEFAEKFANSLPVKICVVYHAAIRLSVEHEGQPVFLLWRESAQEVGNVAGVLGDKAEDLVLDQKEWAAKAFSAMMLEQGDAKIRPLIDQWLNACGDMADEQPELESLGRGMIAAYRQQGIVFGDVHTGNLGLVTRAAGPEWVITDPGNIGVYEGKQARRKRPASDPTASFPARR